MSIRNDYDDQMIDEQQARMTQWMHQENITLMATEDKKANPNQIEQRDGESQISDEQSQTSGDNNERGP